jgi:hypothetical protein
MAAKGSIMITDKDDKKNGSAQTGISETKTTKPSETKPSETKPSEAVKTPPLPVQTNDDPRGHVGARDEQVDHTLTPPAPEESVKKVSN